ncbi:hypothetical protein C8R45DRAFT_1096623 [Mycena sanguinolenta]|nr:hypothetical protein C8R45DRAFT_1096623 [Mycena sanguinolenta]
MLVDAFPACGLGVAVATDGTLYQTEVFAASHSPSSPALLSAASSVSSVHGHGSSSSSHRGSSSDRPVLLLLGIRLGLDGVNPIYYEKVKRLYTFPQCVGIAGGRPSFSYYFVGVQGDELFYVDPHHSRSAVPLRPLPSEGIPRSPGHAASPSSSSHGHASPSSSHAHERRSLSPESGVRARRVDESRVRVVVKLRARGVDEPSCCIRMRMGTGAGSMKDELVVVRPPYASRTASSHGGQNEERRSAGGAMGSAEEAYYARVYTATETRTFYCERLPRTIFAIQDEPPTWPGADDDDMLKSISDPEEEVDVGVSTTSHAASSTSHATSGASHVPASTFSHTHAHHGSNSTTHSVSTSNSSKSGARSEVDTEEDSVAPVMLLPNARFPPAACVDEGHGQRAHRRAGARGTRGGGRCRGRLCGCERERDGGWTQSGGVRGILTED